MRLRPEPTLVASQELTFSEESENGVHVRFLAPTGTAPPEGANFAQRGARLAECTVSGLIAHSLAGGWSGADE
jgi:hypothetical protein